MITPKLIDKASTIMSGEDFVELFIIPTGRNGKLKLNINDLYIKDCPDIPKRYCTGLCYECWKIFLEQHGFEFENLNLIGENDD